LLSVVIDADLTCWEHHLGDVEGPVRAMRSAAALLASLLLPAVAEQVEEATGGTVLATVDEELQPVVPLQVPGIAQALPTDTAFQVTRLADRLGLPAIDVVIEVANAVTMQRVPVQSAVGLVAGSFPAGPLEMLGESAPTQRLHASRPGRPRIAGRQK
jgi:hypothetical protein